MKPTIYVKTKNVYGRDLVYPSCEDSHKFAKLLGVKTFNSHQISMIIELGYIVKEDYLHLGISRG